MKVRGRVLSQLQNLCRAPSMSGPPALSGAFTDWYFNRHSSLALLDAGTRIQCQDKFVAEIQELSQFRVEVRGCWCSKQGPAARDKAD
jgi:hypothetical protein